jgi:hypothetical protein
MPAYLSDKEVTPKTHTHHCSFCESDFDCALSFCAGANPMKCDSCWRKSEGAEALAEYMRARQA